MELLKVSPDLFRYLNALLKRFFTAHGIAVKCIFMSSNLHEKLII